MQETYQSLVQSQVKHAVEQYKTLYERCKKELEAAKAARKSLEAEVTQLRQQRRPPRHDKRFRPPHLQTGGSAVNMQFNSRVPVPVRPSTPLRLHPSRDSSASSTLISSVDSLFSKATAKSNGSLESENSARSSTPESPIIAHTAVSPTLSHCRLHEEREDLRSNATERTIRTWAEMVRKPVVEKPR
jgi:hypothetical protein